MDNNPFSTDWMKGWSDLQQKMWEDWSDVTQNSWAKTWQKETPMNFFREGMKNWPGAGAFGSAPQTPEAMAMQNAMSSMEGFMRMGREVFKVFQNLTESGAASQDWTTQLDRIIQQTKEMFAKSGASPLAAMGNMPNMGNMGNMGDLSAMWSTPMKAWTDMLSSNPMFSNDIMRSMLTGGQSADELMTRFLSMPGLGPNREKQEKFQEGLRLGLEYRKHFEEFQTLMNQSTSRALDLLHRKLLEVGAEGKSLQTLHDLYVLWVDCNEEANAATVSGKEFNEVNARMTNALMRVRKHMGDVVDESLGTMNMPTRRELDSAHKQISLQKKRIQALEDEMQELRSKDSSADINALRDDMEKLGIRRLREEVADLKRQLQESLLADPVEPPGSLAEASTSANKKTVRIGVNKASGAAVGSTQKGD
ncbi:MAG: class III poly(R)-hydroxyalkanoic acid synthase subunit PhaE [Magnetococcales bacterium]|nr:class III poly(R)-hydroxyalkanoic acid synthase subunit PhaE [Magnetococcales bacterium]